jgi:HEAT repeat protein
MRARFDAMLDGYQGGLHARRANPGAARFRTWGLQFAAAAAVLVFGVAIGQQMTRTPVADPQLASLREELRDMRHMVTLSLLQQQSASARLKGVSFINQIDQPDSEVTLALLDALMHDPNVNVRLATIDALKRLSTRETVRRGAIEALSRQTSPLVQIALIDFVVEQSGREAAETLRQLSSDPMVDQAVRARALRGLQQIG